MYVAIPEGGKYELPPANPKSMCYRLEQIRRLSKQLSGLVPNSGQTSVGAGQQMIVSLPANYAVIYGCLNSIAKVKHNTV